MSSFVGLYTGLSGIRAAQTGIDVTSNNVSNANTPGYTRQRVELAASHSYQSAAGLLGTGVDVQSIARLRDSFLDDRFRSAVGEQAAAGARAEFLANLESLSGEPDQGLSNRIGKLWPAAEAWANDPNDPATRGQVIAELQSIAEGFRATATEWEQLGIDTAARRDTSMDVANATLRSLDDLNGRLTNADPDRVGPDLLDQRDLLLDQIAQLTGATSRIGEDGSVTVTLGDIDLLTPDGPATLTLGDGVDAEGEPWSDSLITVVAPTADPDVTVTTDVTQAVSGEVGGLHRTITQDLPRWTQELDALALALADAVNTVNGEGVLPDGTNGGPLLAGDSAATLRLDDGVTGASLAAAGALEPPATEPAPHDARNARAFAELRTTRLPDDDGSTLETQLADLIVGLAGDVRSARATSDAAGGVATGANLARAAEHGVSLDEEMVSLVRYQRALEAAARVMTTVDQALEVLVNRVGIVGR